MKMFGAVVALLVLLVAVLLLAGHGPGRHVSGLSPSPVTGWGSAGFAGQFR
jgi:hypothetical protein